MSAGIRDLSDEHIVQITTLLARRPEYGIAIPSRRWLQRQEEKISHLPKELSRPSTWKRIAIKIAETIDPNSVDPRAILCTTHSTLNPFVIRKLFIALAYEVTVHTDPLRSWQGRVSSPELSAFVGRLDSITALWTEPQLFNEVYGLTPFEGSRVFVQSQCEACCLAAVGASGQALADLRAALIDRMERRPPMPAEKSSRRSSGIFSSMSSGTSSGSSSGKSSEEEPRLYRVVEAWIDQLRKHREFKDRAKECRTMSEAILIELRVARPQITAWRAQLKRQHAEFRAEQRPVFAELKRSNTGAAKIAFLPASSGHKRSTRNGIPVALADTQGAEGQRRAAENVQKRESIYRPDSLAGYSIANPRRQSARLGQQPMAHSLPAGGGSRLSVPGLTNGVPNQSFLNRFEKGVSMSINEGNPYEEYCEDDRDLNDEDYMEKSRSKVSDWWANQLNMSQHDIGQDDRKSVLSMVHPAFRPDGSHIAASALPDPLHPQKDDNPRVAASDARSTTAASVWTDCSVYTMDPDSSRPDARDVPPVPEIPSAYRSRTNLPQTGGDGVANSNSNSPKDNQAPLNWPAPPQGRSSRHLAVPQSVAGSSTVSMAASSLYDGTYSVSSISSAVPSLGPSRSRRSAIDPLDYVRPEDSMSNVYLNRAQAETRWNLPAIVTPATGSSENNNNDDKNNANPEFVCPFCSDTMRSLAQLNRHIEDSHKETEQDKVKTRPRTQTQTQTQTRADNPEFVCPFCSDIMRSLAQLNRHIEDSHKEMPKAVEREEVQPRTQPRRRMRGTDASDVTQLGAFQGRM
ncbi:hypothetical protein F5B18DRAFT_61413 [Nemania serpens]|nr:hypothetical protein F5B18DRAFT_61413 [Nemania serpens]